MTFNLMVARGEPIRLTANKIQCYTLPEMQYVRVCTCCYYHDEKKTLIYELRWTQLLGRDIRWPGYITVLLETSIRLIHFCF